MHPGGAGTPPPGGAGGGGSELRGRDGTGRVGGTGGGCPSRGPSGVGAPIPSAAPRAWVPPSPLSPWPGQRSPESVPSTALQPHPWQPLLQPPCRASSPPSPSLLWVRVGHCTRVHSEGCALGVSVGLWFGRRPVGTHGDTTAP